MAGMKELEEKLKTDESFKKDLLESNDLKEFCLKIKDAGFDVTPQELHATVKTEAEGVVSDDDLESVAGGSSTLDQVWGAVKFALTDPVNALVWSVQTLADL